MKKILSALFSLCAALAAAQTATLTTDAIRVRDPFIFADAPSKTYYLYAQAENRAGSGYQGVEVYTSTDLKTWQAPRPVLTLPADSGVAMVWAPEMHAYQGAYYLFVTLTFRDTLPVARPVDAPHWPRMHRRGTWNYRAESPAGPFKPLKNGPHTPADWMALDGTLYVEDGTPYMIFKTFEGRLRLALHQPNTGPLERLRLFGLTDDGDALRLESE